jgi:fatty-acid desaturase
MKNTNVQTVEKNYIHLWIIHIPAILGILYSFYIFPLIVCILLIVIAYLLATFSVSVGYHRYFTHQSFKTNKFWHYTLFFLSTLSGAGPIPVWVTAHNTHHKFSDKEGDPHSPKIYGRIGAFFTGWFAWPTPKDKKIQELSYGIWYKRSKLMKFTTDYYIFINVCVLIGLFFTSSILFSLYCFHCILVLTHSSIVNTWGHWYGESKNWNKAKYLLCWFDLLYHGNHHKTPYRYRFGPVDPSATVIELIKSN